MAGPARSVIHAGGAVLYASSPDGSRAGIATLQPDQDNVSIELHEAASISGQVVDDNGQPVASRAVELQCTATPRIPATPGIAVHDLDRQ